MKESASSPWFATRVLNAGTSTSRPRPDQKQTPPSRFGSCCTAPEHNHPSSFASSFSCHHSSQVTSPSPFRSSLVVIPFSWEKQPGVPKQSFSHHHHHRQPSRDQHRAPFCPKLPLPPPLRSNSDPFLSATRRKKKQDRRPAEDPFALAMLECSREDRLYKAEDEDPAGVLSWKGSPAAALKAAGGRRKAAGEWFGLVDLYGFCKTTCSVANSAAVRVPRSGRAAEAYGLLTRQGR